MNYFRRMKEAMGLNHILDVPILIFEENDFCYTDLEAVKQFYRDEYAEEYDSANPFEAEEYEEVLKLIDEQTLESFADFEYYKDWGMNTYLDSIRDTIWDYLSDIMDDPKDIYYENNNIIVPIKEIIDESDMEWMIEEMESEYLFGADSCIGREITYDKANNCILISADFSGLNAEYPR